MDTSVRLRCSTAEVEEWRKYAGERGLSRWLRGLANATVGMGEAPRPNPHAPAAASPLRAPQEDPTGGDVASPSVPTQRQPARRVIKTPKEAAEAVEMTKPGVIVSRETLCRHGLMSCRVCQTGSYAE